MNTDKYMTVEETAQLLNVKKSWVYERTRAKTIPVRKIGHHVRIPRQELIEWIDDGCGADSNQTMIGGR
jgi:excisionase family DNA binding protein